MANEFKNYSFKNVNAIFGILEITGWGDGDDVLSAEVPEDQFADLSGAKGDVARSQTNDNRCTIVIKVLQTSSINKELTTIYNADREFGTGVQPFAIEDKETGESYFVPNSWIKKFPAVVRGKGVNMMEWTFRGDLWIPKIT